MPKFISCPTCNKEIVSDLPCCPYCGSDISPSVKKSSPIIWNTSDTSPIVVTSDTSTAAAWYEAAPWQKKRIIAVIAICATIVAIIMGLYMSNDISLPNSREYKAYKYAKECVKEELGVDSAKFSSLGKVTIEKSQYSTDIKYLYQSYEVEVKDAFDISGNVTYNNSLGKKVTRKFTVTVFKVDGFLKCYKCELEFIA